MPSTAQTPRRSSPPKPTWLESLPHGRDLDRAELRRLVRAVASDAATWRSLVRHDHKQRQYIQLHRDPHVDIWLLAWSNQQDTGLHDHDVSSGAVHVCIGDLVEDRLYAGPVGLERRSVNRPQGRTFDFDASHVHCLRHPDGGSPAVSIHVYSPALWRMGHYEIGDDGLLRRLSVSYAEETAV
jgi:hypothetical protein